MFYAFGPILFATLFYVIGDFLKKKKTDFGARYLFILGVILFAAVGLKGYLSDAFTQAVFYADENQIDSLITDKIVLLAFVRWGLLLAEIAAATYAVTGSLGMRRVAARVGLPLSVVSLAFTRSLLACYISVFPDEVWNFGIQTPAWLRVVFFSLEVGVTLAVSAQALWWDIKSPAPYADKIGLKHALTGAICAIPFTMSAALFGMPDTVIHIGDPLQFVWIAIIVGFLLGIFFLYRGADEKEKKAILTFLTLYLFYHFNQTFTVGIKMNRLPFQLCNLGAYLLVLLLIFRSQKFFDFIFIANSAGCIIAIATMAEDSTIFSFWANHYYVQHTFVYIIPLLYAMLGVYKLPRGRKAIHHYGFGYTVYVAGCVLLNAVENGLIWKNGLLIPEVFNDVNFFYTLKCPVPELGELFTFINVGAFSIFGTEFRLGYLSFVYLVFGGLALLEYLGYRAIANAYVKRHK